MPPPQTVRLELSPELRKALRDLTKAVQNLKFTPPDFTELNAQLRKNFPNVGTFEIDEEPFDPMGSTVIAPECFIDNEGRTISYKGENFYKFCGRPVRVLAGETQTMCVLPFGHDGVFHVDWDGTNKEI